MQPIKISGVHYDPQYYPRVNGREDWQTVARYQGVLKADPTKADPKKNKKAFPPIVVVRKRKGEAGFQLLDGLHRLKAFKAAGLETIYAEVERIPQSKWLARSVELNIAGQRPLDSGDLTWVAVRLEKEGWQPKQVAKLLCIEVPYLEKLKVQRCQKLRVSEAKKLPEGRANRKINGGQYGFVKAPFTDLTGTNKAAEALAHQAQLHSGSVASVLDCCIAVLESATIDLTDTEIVKRLRQIEELLQKWMAVA